MNDQLKILMAEGTATKKVINEKTMLAYVDWPATNMWCPQTKKPRTAMANDEKATKEYPNTRLREKQATTSLMTAKPGKIMMYTAGCE